MSFDKTRSSLYSNKKYESKKARHPARGNLINTWYSVTFIKGTFGMNGARGPPARNFPLERINYFYYLLMLLARLN